MTTCAALVVYAVNIRFGRPSSWRAARAARARRARARPRRGLASRKYAHLGPTSLIVWPPSSGGRARTSRSGLRHPAECTISGPHPQSCSGGPPLEDSPLDTSLNAPEQWHTNTACCSTSAAPRPPSHSNDQRPDGPLLRGRRAFYSPIKAPALLVMHVSTTRTEDPVRLFP